MKKIISILLVAVFSQLLSFAQSSIQPFKSGDKVVFTGDSITDGGHYHSYIWLYYVTHFPFMDIEIINAGIGGNTAADIYYRLDGDVFSNKPTVLFLTFGMNDTGYGEYNRPGAKEFGEKKYAEACDNFMKIVSRLKSLENVHIIMLGGSPYDETSKMNDKFHPGKNDVIAKINAFQQKIAAENGWEYLDFNAPMVARAIEIQKENPSFTMTVGDRVHPDNAAHMMMAYLILKAQGMAGKPVADIQIDAVKKNVVKSDNCNISNIKRDLSQISFDYLAQSLPYPLDDVAHGLGAKQGQSEIKKLIPDFMKEMNSEMLSVIGLKGNYTLLIDNVQLGTWSAEQLEEGINLAELFYSPQYQQSLAIMHLNEQRWEIDRNFRDFAWIQYGFFQGKGLLNANDQKSVEVLDANKDRNVWLQIHKENYLKMMNPYFREARQGEKDYLLKTMYEINKPQTRHIILRHE